MSWGGGTIGNDPSPVFAAPNYKLTLLDASGLRLVPWLGSPKIRNIYFSSLSQSRPRRSYATPISETRSFRITKWIWSCDRFFLPAGSRVLLRIFIIPPASRDLKIFVSLSSVAVFRSNSAETFRLKKKKSKFFILILAAKIMSLFFILEFSVRFFKTSAENVSRKIDSWVSGKIKLLRWTKRWFFSQSLRVQRTGDYLTLISNLSTLRLFLFFAQRAIFLRIPSLRKFFNAQKICGEEEPEHDFYSKRRSWGYWWWSITA